MPRPRTLYHYTSHQGYKGIQSDGYVRGSIGQGARHGDGVYLTSLNPTEQHSLCDIVKNNIDGNPNQWSAPKMTNKVKIALKFKIPRSEVEKADLKHHRDVWVYDDEDDLWLEDYFTGVVYEWGPYGYKQM